MNRNKSLTVLVLIVAITGNCFAVPNPKARNTLLIGNVLYFSDTEENRTRADAAAYCEAEGGQLAKILNNNLYNQLRLATKKLGAYWIDGIDKADGSRFNFNQNCSIRGEFLDLSKVPRNNLDFQQFSCLSLVKGNTARNCKLQAANCNEERFVLCQFSVNGCRSTTTTTTDSGLNIVVPEE